MPHLLVFGLITAGKKPASKGKKVSKAEKNKHNADDALAASGADDDGEHGHEFISVSSQVECTDGGHDWQKYHCGIQPVQYWESVFAA